MFHIVKAKLQHTRTDLKTKSHVDEYVSHLIPFLVMIMMENQLETFVFKNKYVKINYVI